MSSALKTNQSCDNLVHCGRCPYLTAECAAEHTNSLFNQYPRSYDVMYNHGITVSRVEFGSSDKVPFSYTTSLSRACLRNLSELHFIIVSHRIPRCAGSLTIPPAAMSLTKSRPLSNCHLMPSGGTLQPVAVIWRVVSICTSSTSSTCTVALRLSIM